jgi:hypothetical protein
MCSRCELVSYGGATFEKNVSVNGGSFQTLNGGWVTINGNLSFVNPANNDNGGNGFWGSTGPNEVKAT